MFRSMLGIETDGSGFKAIMMKPEFGAGVTWAKGHYDSIRGRIVSDWKQEGNSFRWNVTVPANTSATLFIPAAESAGITESGHPVKEAAGVTFVRMEADRAVFRVEAGSYDFLSSIDGPQRRK
jgi:alpha-L-rhamnosidase